MAITQASIPDSFSNLWRVAGWHDEHEHAQKLCRALGYETNADGVDLVRVAFVERTDFFDADEALIHAHMLFPA